MGFDCHDTGAMTLAHLLRDQGMEVVYLGLHNSAQKIAVGAVQEDVDVIGVSFLSGQHMHHIRGLIAALRERKVEGVVLIVGGIIPREDVKALKGLGVDECFGPGTSVHAIAEYITREVARRKPGLFPAPQA